MVGHTGVIPAAVKAVETVDECLARVLAAAQRANARVLVTADHGNCEMMIDPATGGPHTAHTTNPVPLVIVDPDGDRPLRDGGALRDVGPTVLAMLGVEKPSRDDRHRPQRDWSRNVKLALTAALLCLGIAPLAAQVGSEPEKSPYQDFTYHQDFTVFGGYFGGNKGTANVGPQSSPIFGVRYGLHIGGPAELSVRVGSASVRPATCSTPRRTAPRAISARCPIRSGSRDVADQPRAHRAEELSPLRIPSSASGVGSSRSNTSADVGGYSFGTGFAIHFGGGLKFVTHGPWGARLDRLGLLLAAVGIRARTSLAPTGGTSILPQGQAQNEWKQNPTITFGISYIISR